MLIFEEVFHKTVRHAERLSLPWKATWLRRGWMATTGTNFLFPHPLLHGSNIASDNPKHQIMLHTSWLHTFGQTSNILTVWATNDDSLHEFGNILFDLRPGAAVVPLRPHGTPRHMFSQHAPTALQMEFCHVAKCSVVSGPSLGDR